MRLRLLLAFTVPFLFSLSVSAENSCKNPHPKVSEFFRYVEAGDKNEILKFFKTNIVAHDSRNEYCETAFHVAIRNNDMELFDFLYDQFEEPDISNNFGRIYPRENKEYLSLLLRFGSRLYTYALIFGTKDTMDHIKNMGHEFYVVPYRPNYKLDTKEKIKALILAHNQTSQGRILLFRHIKNNDVDINHMHEDPGAYTNSVMLAASSTAPTDRLRFLIENFGGEVNKANNFKRTPLYYASRASDLKMGRENAKLLIEKGAKHKASKEDETPLMYFSRNGASTVIEKLGQQGVDMSYRPTIDVHSPIVWAIEANQYESVETLVEWGASINHIEENDFDDNPSSKRPYYYAKNEEMRNLLVNLGAMESD